MRLNSLPNCLISFQSVLSIRVHFVGNVPRCWFRLGDDTVSGGLDDVAGAAVGSSIYKRYCWWYCSSWCWRQCCGQSWEWCCGDAVVVVGHDTNYTETIAVGRYVIIETNP